MSSRPHASPPHASSMKKEAWRVTGWFLDPLRQQVEWLLRFAVRPPAETILFIDAGERQFPPVSTLGLNDPEPPANA